MKESTDDKGSDLSIPVVTEIQGDTDEKEGKTPKLLRYVGSAPAHVVESVLLETVGQLRLALLALDPSKASQTSIDSTRDRAATLQGLLVRKLGPVVDCMQDLQECTLRPSHAISRSVVLDLYKMACDQAAWDMDDKSAESFGISLLSETIQAMDIIRSVCTSNDQSIKHERVEAADPPVS